MASKYWIKLYHEILHDPKMGRMSDTLWRRTIELFLLAGEFDQDGVLPGIQEITWTLRISETECNVSLHELQRLGIIHCNDNGEWVVTKFCDRQSAANNTERSRQFRQRKKHEKRMQPLRQAENVPESNQNGPIEAQIQPVSEILEQSLPETKMQRNVAPDTDTDTDTIPKGIAAPPPTSQNPSKNLDDKKPPEAVTVYRTIARRFPDKSTWEIIGRTVGGEPSDLDFWREVVTAYIRCGWNKLNVDGMLKFYRERRIPTTEKIAAQKEGSANGQPSKYRPKTWADTQREKREAAGGGRPDFRILPAH